MVNDGIDRIHIDIARVWIHDGEASVNGLCVSIVGLNLGLGSSTQHLIEKPSPSTNANLFNSSFVLNIYWARQGLFKYI